MTPSSPEAAPALRVQRLPLPPTPELLGDDPLPFGALGYGTRGNAPWLAGVEARLLGPGGPMADLWQVGGRVQAGAHGALRWRTDGHWMAGAIDLDEAAEPAGLAALAERAYRELFATLDASGCTQLLRLWNYLPRINDAGQGLERYRQFNLGRQQAFLDAGRGVLEGAPAACALGVKQGEQLSIRFLAGRDAPLAIENPRQVSAYRYPSDYGPRPPTFSRAALADIGGGQLALFISGTASIVGHQSLHPGDVREQTRETLRNLGAVVDAANARCSARFRVAALDCVAYVRHDAQAPLVREVLQQALGAGADTVRRAIFLEADICRQDLLVEIEAHAVAAGTFLRS